MHPTPPPRRRRRAAALALLASAALLALPLAASAQAKKQRGRTLSFEEDTVETTYLRPEGSSIQGIGKKKRQSLIRVRLDFFKEIRRSARDI